ncbi:pyridoxal phosphate homeostasis protein-like [Asterias rubens]|uniref:pyridoxal phosphate homeostasis protein-like n=1 Tax=Asterias rubens TaxID=7604 RepID=UPI0014557EEB|nr:pyridoxal phosphate homeostasis protein-like [Asterias rubens]
MHRVFNAVMAAEREIGQIGRALQSVGQRVESAFQSRDEIIAKESPELRLVAVTKTKPKEMVIEAYKYGQKNFGENYVQELVEKSHDDELQKACNDIRWHFIGHLQTNKVKKVLESPNLYMVETVDSMKLANEINKTWERLNKGHRLKVMVQINTSREEQKHGVPTSECCNLYDHIRQHCQALDVVGIMTIGAFDHDLSKGPNPDFQALIKCREDICSTFSLPKESIELSMGMSNDFEHAIENGSTNIRVGSTIFGARTYKTKPETVKTKSVDKAHEDTASRSDQERSVFVTGMAELSL